MAGMSREEVIAGLNDLHGVASGLGGDQCYLNGIGIKQLQALIDGATELLKAEEPVRPERSGRGTCWYYCCGNCGKPLDPGDPYCRGCGRAVAWSTHTSV